MIPGRFTYEAPGSVAEAVELLAEEPGAGRVLGGGTWLVPELNRGDAQPRLVVDLRRAGLAEISVRDGRLHVGATCTYSDLLRSEAVAERLPLLRRMAEEVTGGRQIANQGTIGGSLAAARPSSDAPAAVVALAAEAVVAGPEGERRCPAPQLLAGPMQSSLGPAEILLRLEFPLADTRPGAGYVKLKRGVSSWPIATATCLVELDGSGRCAAVSLVLGGVAATPVRVDVGGLLGARPDEAALAEAQERAGEAVTEPWEDELAPTAYRAAVAGPVARRALEAAFLDAAVGRAGDEL